MILKSLINLGFKRPLSILGVPHCFEHNIECFGTFGILNTAKKFFIVP